MRTLDQFTTTYEQAEWFVYFHNKPVWLIALDNDYVLSVIKPKSDEIAYGTVAILYGEKMAALEKVDSTKRPCGCALN